MPELPEVETIRLGLNRLLSGRVVVDVTYDWPKGFPNSASEVKKFLIGAKITNIRRRAKVLMIDLSSKYSLVIHLKMTGQLVYRGAQNFGAGHPTDSLIGELPDKSTRVIITFKNKSVLYFNDQRKFGWMRLLPTAEIPNIDFMKKVGPEPLDPNFSANDFVNRLQKRKKSSIKAA
jgi:formamidopyrimidine-DNA glycosylase